MHKTTSNRIWRTVVFAGAMLGAGTMIGCGGGKTAAAPTTPVPAGEEAAKQDEAALATEAADKKAADDAALATKAADDKAAADEAAAKLAEEEAAKAKAEEEAAAKKRPRGGNSRPTGRGFVLA